MGNVDEIAELEARGLVPAHAFPSAAANQALTVVSARAAARHSVGIAQTDTSGNATGSPGERAIALLVGQRATRRISRLATGSDLALERDVDADAHVRQPANQREASLGSMPAADGSTASGDDTRNVGREMPARRRGPFVEKTTCENPTGCFREANPKTSRGHAGSEGADRFLGRTTRGDPWGVGLHPEAAHVFRVWPMFEERFGFGGSSFRIGPPRLLGLSDGLEVWHSVQA